MIALDTSAIVAILLDEPEADIPVLTAKRFSNPGEIVARFSQAPNITPVDFDGNPPSRRWSAMAKVAILPA
ncbi:uncharacterized protein with PIN domain [Rhizobium pisi]